MSIFRLTALQLAEAIRAGEVSPVEAVEVALKRVEASALNAYITVTAETALQRAHALERQSVSGILAGVPVGVKDNICTLNIRTTCASRMLDDFHPPYDAAVVERFHAGGGILLGKLNMDEFAMGSTGETSFYGSVPNPWDPSRVSGGSSSGAAAAVAAGECWYALGSDTGGSLRLPAAWCGVTGIKPTYGTVSRYGLIAYASSLDQIGPIARTAQDCAAVLDLIGGKDHRDSTCVGLPGNLLENLSADLTGLRVGIPVDCFGEDLDSEVRSHVLAVAEGLKARGAVVESCALPIMDYVVPTYYILATAEASSNLARYDGVKYGYRSEKFEDLHQLYCRSRSEGFGPQVRRRILLGTFVLSEGYYDAYYDKALRARAWIRQHFDTLFDRYDLLLTPTTPTTAPKLGEQDPLQQYLGDRYTVSANLAGLPALSMPCGFDSNGLPIGAQLIAAPFGEQKLLNAAHAWQQDTPWHRVHPEGGGL